jgi:hypothetical protein
LFVTNAHLKLNHFQKHLGQKQDELNDPKSKPTALRPARLEVHDDNYGLISGEHHSLW